MTSTARRAPLAGWSDAAVRGGGAFLVMAGAGQLLAVAVWAVGGVGGSLATFAGVGVVYLGAFHHVAVELEIPNVASAAGPVPVTLSVGVALLSATALAGWLLFRAGRVVAERLGGSPAVRVLHAMKIVPAYALPVFALALLVRIRTPIRPAVFGVDEVRLGLSAWQGLVFPAAISAVAAAAGGLRSAFEDRPRDRAMVRAGAALAGGWRMLVAGAALAFGGLAVAGAVQPDGAAALLTPSTARYVRVVFERPGWGLVILGHHLALVPNEAIWTLVPAMGACDEVRGSATEDLLCYGRFPVETSASSRAATGDDVVRTSLGSATFDDAPAPYLLFLLVPAVAAVLGGRRAAARLGGSAAETVLVAAAAGGVFAGLVAATAMLSGVTVSYAAGAGAARRAFVAGPDVAAGALAGLAWGVAGGVLGAITIGPARRLTTGWTRRRRWRARAPAP